MASFYLVGGLPELSQSSFNFAHSHARRLDPATSKRAADTSAQRAANVEAKVYRALVDAGLRGLTYPEAQQKTGYRSAQQRLSDLKFKRMAIDTGETRPHSLGGSDCSVFIADVHYEPGVFG